ncbi:hypothetical protein NAI60_09400, partial [Francisella tularensis subsp. holarctica]|uniref:hypothetical protein n=1 Tax=Francisella tularensis TaxID=263 RepID=UPI002381CBD0
DLEYWAKIQEIRSELNRVIEIKRNEDVIKASIEAEITNYAYKYNYKLLEKHGNEHRFLLISSKAYIKEIEESTRSTNAANILGILIEITKI